MRTPSARGRGGDRPSMPWRLAGSATAFGVAVALLLPPGQAPDAIEVVAPVPTSTPTPEATSTPVGPPAPLTGWPTEAALLGRRAVAVKIDNHADSRPQSGLNVADAVIELPVESGLTRFIALFHSSDMARVGPVRSGRPTDPTLLRPLGVPLLISGAQPWILDVIRAAGVPVFVDVGEPVTFRSDERSAPNNLYADTRALRDAADRRDLPDAPPPTWFLRTPDGTPEGVAVSMVRLPFSDETTIDWTIRDGTWRRDHNGLPHLTIGTSGREEQVAADHLVILAASPWTARNPVDGGGVPALTTTGTGAAWVVVGGERPRMVSGTWSRDEIDEIVRIRDDDGNDVAIAPGRLWISWIPDDRPVAFDPDR